LAKLGGGIALLRASSAFKSLKVEGVDIIRRSAIQNASSISALMLTTEAMICEIPEKKPAAPAGGDHHGGPGHMDY